MLISIIFIHIGYAFLYPRLYYAKLVIKEVTLVIRMMHRQILSLVAIVKLSKIEGGRKYRGRPGYAMGGKPTAHKFVYGIIDCNAHAQYA